MLFKTNTKIHKHPSIRFISKSKTQFVNQRKQKVAFSPGTAHSPIVRDGVQLRQLLNDTPVVYTTYNSYKECTYIYIYTYISTQSFWAYIRPITRIRNVHTYIYIHIYQHRASGREPRSSGGNTSCNPQVSALIPRPVVNGMERGCASAMGAIKLPPSCSSPKIMCQSIYI